MQILSLIMKWNSRIDVDVSHVLAQFFVHVTDCHYLLNNNFKEGYCK